MSLQKKTVSGILWSGLSNSSTMIIEFVIGIILARILSPDDFGLLGMITIFIGISQIFVNSGFSNALIRKTDCTNEDYATVFSFNLAVGIVLFFVLFLIAPLVGEFYERTELVLLLRFLAISILISSVTIVQRSQVIQKLNFRLLSKIRITSSLLSGIIAIIGAYSGFGVWALVVKTVSREAIESSLLWVKNRWAPKLLFNRKSFDELFGFGSKLLLSGIIATTFQNLYYVIIGKFYLASDLGYFTRAEMFRKLPSENISGTVTSVAYPALAKVKDDPIKLKEGFKKILLPISLVVFSAMFGMMVVADPLIISLLGKKWEATIPMLQILCLFGLFVPLNSLNANMLNVLGRSDLYLKTQLFLQFSKVPVVILGILYGIKILLVGMVVSAALSYIVFVLTAQKITFYTISEQIKDVLPNLIVAIIMAYLVWSAGNYISFSPIYNLLVLVSVGIVSTIVLCEISKNKSYVQMKSILILALNKSK